MPISGSSITTIVSRGLQSTTKMYGYWIRGEVFTLSSSVAFVRRITCGRSYCEICGIILGAFADSSSLDSETRYDNGVLDSKKINKDIEK